MKVILMTSDERIEALLNNLVSRKKLDKDKVIDKSKLKVK